MKPPSTGDTGDRGTLAGVQGADCGAGGEPIGVMGDTWAWWWGSGGVSGETARVGGSKREPPRNVDESVEDSKRGGGALDGWADCWGSRAEKRLDAAAGVHGKLPKPGLTYGVDERVRGVAGGRGAAEVEDCALSFGVGAEYKSSMKAYIELGSTASSGPRSSWECCVF